MLEKEIGFTQRGKMSRKEGGEEKVVGGVGWKTGEEDCLFSAGQTRLSSTFSHRDESALRGRQRLLALAAPGKQAEEYRRQRGET